MVMVVTVGRVILAVNKNKKKELLSNTLPAVIGVVDVQFGNLVAVGPFDIWERIRQLFLVMFLEFFIEHGHFIG